MPNWKKVIVSGSNVSQLNNDGVYLKTVGNGILSSSAQVTISSTNGFTAFSSSIANSAVAGILPVVTTNQITLGFPTIPNQSQIVTTQSGSTVFSGSTNYVLDTFMTGSGQASGFEYNYVASNGVSTGRMGTIKLIMGDGFGISHFETSTPDIDPFDAPTTNLVFSFDANGTAPNNGRFLVSNNTDANLVIIYERKEYIIFY